MLIIDREETDGDKWSVEEIDDDKWSGDESHGDERSGAEGSVTTLLCVPCVTGARHSSHA